MRIRAAIAVLAFLIPFAAGADDAAPPAEARIPFANHGGIWDWRVVDDRTVLIQSNGRQWYKATLMSACFNLPFAQRVGFQSNPDGSFDKFSAIKLRGQTCPLISLVKTDPPAKKAKRHPPAEVTTAPASESQPGSAAPPPATPPQ
jgi:hypothetical protein